MRHSIPIKFIAIMLTALALVAAFVSALGIMQVVELGLYTDGFDSWVRNRLEWQAYDLARNLTDRYGVRTLTNCPDELLSQLGRNPTIEEIAEALHITVEEATVYEAMLNQARNRQRIDAERAPKEEEPDDNQQVENTAYFQERQRVLEMLSTLTEQEMKVIVLRFGLEGGLPLTPEQTAEKLGVALNDVRKMERTALRKMRGHGQ